LVEDAIGKYQRMEKIKNMQRVTRVAFVSEHASPVALLGGTDAGGQNVYVDEVSRHLAQRGYAVDVLTRRDNPAISEVINWVPGIRVINLTAGPAEYRSKDEIWPYMPAFRDACLNFMDRNEVQYDIVHSNFWMSGWVATELRRILDIPVAHIFHALGVTKRRHQGEADTSPHERIVVEAQVAQNVDYLITPCPTEEAELIEYYGAQPPHIRMIPLAVNTKVFQPVKRLEARRRLGLSMHDFVIVYVGRVLPRKDIRNIVRALPELLRLCAHDEHTPKIQLLVVGGETLEPDPQATPEIGVLQRLSAELGVAAHVHFVGNRQQNMLRYYYSAGDVVVTTPWYEPFGLTPLEGMACGRPIIGSSVGGIMYSIIDGETGFLVPPRRPEALAERLYYLLKHPECGERMGRVARQHVLQEFTWSMVAERTAEVYEESLVRRSVFQHHRLRSFRSTLLDAPSVGGGE
jgi:glycosyltransferase involved in cell wall biosynthesis